MKEVEVIGVSIMPNKRQFYIHLANEQKIRVDYTEYAKMKKRLSGKSKIFMNVEDSGNERTSNQGRTMVKR